ncbi:uncharacterized protein LOC103316883 [Nasonia vitripennis]|uniref:CHK kinase-like domain-containing protein n=1 Tax=Nasonia vitripennis TaxID=7425 RepID=A0A7M7IPM7_NASVI|nr:uncharacterized protein LOC103316883 [Nasonia vitripennis]XP_016836846.1 uncharacterized protein LOC103316883 [Nasonia vitripennis]XP_031779666.1 uncharacterized protein LOC103316883 [Nasonia vitripennis]
MSDKNINLTRVTKTIISSLIAEILPSKQLTFTKFQVKPFSSEKLGYMGIHELLTIETCVNNEIQSFTFFVKSLVPSHNDFEELTFLEESNFFKNVMPRLLKGHLDLQTWAAKCYLSNSNVIVLENLKSQGFDIVKDVLLIGQLRSAVTSLARFHSSSILLENKVKKPLNELYPGFFEEKLLKNIGNNWKWLSAGIEVVEVVARKLGLEPKHATAAYTLMLERIKPANNQRNVLCHSDLWCNNLMFKDNQDGTSSCRFVDFQMVAYNCYVMDLVQLIHLNTNEGVRKKIEEELVELYHSVLTKNLRKGSLENGEIIKLKEIFEDLKERRIFGLVIAAQYFPIVLLNKKLTAEFTKDSSKLKKYMYRSRKNFVLRCMRLDQNYRKRIEESVRELIEYIEESGKAHQHQLCNTKLKKSTIFNITCLVRDNN